MTVKSEAEVIDVEPDTGRAVAPLAPSAGPANMLDIIKRADKLDPEKLKMLMDMQERWDAGQARKAFDAAMAAAKAEIQPITKNRKVGFASKKEGAARTDYKHEDLGEIARAVDPILARHGLSYRWSTKNAPNEPITVTCKVAHELGHFEENTLSAGRDDSGNKNSIQAIGSTITYLQRYTLKAALGLAASNDDDARASGGDGPIDEAKVAEIQRLIVATGSNIALFCKFMGAESIPEIPASQYDRAIKTLNEKARKQGDKV